MDFWADFKIKIVLKYDVTCWLHLLRDFLISMVISWLFTLNVGIAFALGINFAWEWQDGLKADGFNLLDFFAGVLGILITALILA